jgi:hypothetical protein
VFTKNDEEPENFDEGWPLHQSREDEARVRSWDLIKKCDAAGRQVIRRRVEAGEAIPVVISILL